MLPEDFEMMRNRAADIGTPLNLKSVEAGAATTVYAATAPELEGVGGRHLEDCHLADVDDGETTSEGVRSYALDSEIAVKLWSNSEELAGQTFDL